MKAIVIGCPGSGKSTFAKKLSKYTKTPLCYLDQLNWNADKTAVQEKFLTNAFRQSCRKMNG